MPNLDYPCLGFAETQFFSVTAVVAEAMTKAADVKLLGLEPNGTKGILIRIGGQDPAAVGLALERAEALATELGSSVVSHVMAAPSAEIHSLNTGPLVINPLYGGREEFRPGDFPDKKQSTMNTQNLAIGILETQGLTASLAASDTMFKAANVRLVGKEKIGAAYVTIIIRGNVSAVKAAIEAGTEAAVPFGKVIAAHVIARPHEDLNTLLPN